MFKPAIKEKLKLRLAIEGPSGSGKSYSALLIARGLVGEGGRIAMIDTEKDSGKLYADVTNFDHAALDEPYTPERYIALINMAEKAGYDCVVIDSISHEWTGAGGILEIHDKMPGNSWINWGKCNPRHEAFINAMLKANCHIIATMRSKQSYTQEADGNGKQQVKKLGMAPQQREGMEYEFTAVLKMDITHQCEGDKDRTGLFPVGTWFMPTQQTGEMLGQWLNDGIEAPVTQDTPPPKQPYAPSSENATTGATESPSGNSKLGYNEYQKALDVVCQISGSAGMEKWAAEKKAELGKMSKPDLAKFRKYYTDLLASTKEDEAKPKTWVCPRGGSVTAADCGACEAVADCEVAKNNIKEN